MGASTSSGITTEGLTLDGLMEQANQVLSKVTEVITQTVGSNMGDLRELHERAAATVGSTYAGIHDKLTELTRYSEEAQACVQRKEAELQSIQVKMKNSMLECYGRHTTALEKLRPEREIIHAEAKQFKLEAQKIIENCMASENRLDCFQKGLAELATRADSLMKKFENHIKREIEIQANSTKLLLECDKKAMDEANKSFSRVIEEVQQCGQSGMNKT